VTKQDEIPKLMAGSTPALQSYSPDWSHLRSRTSAARTPVVAYDYLVRPGTQTIDIWIYDCNHADQKTDPDDVDFPNQAHDS